MEWLRRVTRTRYKIGPEQTAFGWCSKEGQARGRAQSRTCQPRPAAAAAGGTVPLGGGAAECNPAAAGSQGQLSREDGGLLQQLQVGLVRVTQSCMHPFSLLS